MRIWLFSLLNLASWICNLLCLLLPVLVLLMLNSVVIGRECLESLQKFLAQELWRSMCSWYLRRNFSFIILNLTSRAFGKITLRPCNYLCLRVVLERLIEMLVSRFRVTNCTTYFDSLCWDILLSVQFWIGLVVFYRAVPTFLSLRLLFACTGQLNLLLMRGHNSNRLREEL